VLSPSLVDFAERGFRTGPAATRSTLEAAARAFLAGYHAELASAPGTALGLGDQPEHRRGFAAEGAAMAATLLDLLRPGGGSRLAALRGAYDDRYPYLIHVGSGWALAKLRRRRLGSLGAHAPLLRWLAYDGMGFCQGFFAAAHGLDRWSRHPRSCPPTCDIRYQGLGRSLWFRACGDPQALAAHIARLPERHRGDAWSGAALAMTYAGGVDPSTLELAGDLAGAYRPELAQGSAFAAEACRHSGAVPGHATTAVGILAGADVATAAGWTWDARAGLDVPGADAGSYRTWRLRVRDRAAVHATHG
jgi:hypothetical protein